MAAWSSTQPRSGNPKRSRSWTTRPSTGAACDGLPFSTRQSPRFRSAVSVVSGGVAANAELRRRLQALCDATPAGAADGGGDDGGSWRLVVPPPRLCTDNGVMVAWAAVESLRLSRSHAAEGRDVRARWPLGPSIAQLTGEVEVPPKGYHARTAKVMRAIANTKPGKAEVDADQPA